MNSLPSRGQKPSPLFDIPDSTQTTPQLRTVDRMTDLLDTKFRLPGTNTRFGVDFLLGLVPGAGDAISLGFSGLLIATMAKHGASARLVLRMLFNVLLDSLVGSIPILGNIFDLYYKANTRNLRLMREYYDQGKHRRSVWPLVALVVVVLLGIFAGLFFLTLFIAHFLWNWFQSTPAT